MIKCNTTGFDLAKLEIQVCVVSPKKKALLNKAFTRKKFAEFQAKQNPGLVAFEACATAHYWSRVASAHGHTARIVPAKRWHLFGKAIKLIPMMRKP